MKSSQFDDCVTVLSFSGTHGVFRVGLIGEKTRQIDEANYWLNCNGKRYAVVMKQIMYIRDNEGTKVHDCHCFDLTMEQGRFIPPAKLIESLTKITQSHNSLFRQ